MANVRAGPAANAGPAAKAGPSRHFGGGGSAVPLNPPGCATGWATDQSCCQIIHSSVFAQRSGKLSWHQTCAWFHRNWFRFRFRNRFRLSRKQSRNQSCMIDKPWFKASPRNQNRNQFHWTKVGIGIDSADEWPIPAPNDPKWPVCPNTLGRCDFFTATDCLTAMAVARTKSHLFRLLTFLWVGVHGPRPMESKRNRFRSWKSGVGINFFWLNGIGIGIDSTWPIDHALLESESESAPVFQSGIGIDSGQLESSTSLPGTTAWSWRRCELGHRPVEKYPACLAEV